ncbi:hypothetical protein RIF29_21593 [Crotalaria pallida]|uniref:Uncharacterized protein n=1 Tax=Crotalaria pallida TaxID=3830 RepID=A0AAN9I8L1_CROPI
MVKLRQCLLVVVVYYVDQRVNGLIMKKWPKGSKISGLFKITTFVSHSSLPFSASLSFPLSLSHFLFQTSKPNSPFSFF